MRGYQPILLLLLCAFAYTTNCASTLVGFAPGTETIEQLNNLTRRKAEAARVYFTPGESVPTTLAEKNVGTYLSQGLAVILSLKYSSAAAPTADELNKLDHYFSLIHAGGFASKVYFTSHHEPYPELTGPAFVNNVYLPSAFVARKYGIKVGPILQAYPYVRDRARISDYVPSNVSTWDFLGIDVYPGSSVNCTASRCFYDSEGKFINPITTTISSFITYAVSRGKPYIVAEFAVPTSLQTEKGAAEWVEAFGSVDSMCEILSYWNGQDAATGVRCGLEENKGLLVPAYQKVFDMKNP